MRFTKILENQLRTWLAVASLLSWSLAFGQSEKTVKTLKTIDFQYGFQAPGADMHDRFGGNNDVGAGLSLFQIASKTFFNVEGRFLFGNNVKEDVLTSLRSYDGNIIGIDGQIGDVNLKERGFFIGLNAGKIFDFKSEKKTLTGLRTQLGVGFLQHKIRVQDNYNNVPALNKAYLNGYDRLTNGPALHLGIGYQYQSPVNNFHFKIMGDLIAAQTKSRRDFDYPTGTRLDAKRLDILYGINIAYVVVISRTRPEEYIYY